MTEVFITCIYFILLLYRTILGPYVDLWVISCHYFIHSTGVYNSEEDSWVCALMGYMYVLCFSLNDSHSVLWINQGLAHHWVFTHSSLHLECFPILPAQATTTKSILPSSFDVSIWNSNITSSLKEHVFFLSK